MAKHRCMPRIRYTGSYLLLSVVIPIRSRLYLVFRSTSIRLQEHGGPSGWLRPDCTQSHLKPELRFEGTGPDRRIPGTDSSNRSTAC